MVQPFYHQTTKPPNHLGGAMTVGLARKLEELLGKEKVLSSEADRLCYSYDATPLVSHLPEVVVRATTEEDVHVVLEAATRKAPRSRRAGAAPD